MNNIDLKMFEVVKALEMDNRGTVEEENKKSWYCDGYCDDS